MDIYSQKDIKEHLKSYQKIKSFDKVKRGTHIKYLKKVSGDTYKYMIGGLLKFNYDDYIVLNSGSSSWSVQKEDHIFYQQIKINEKQLQRRVDDNNSIIKDYGGVEENVIEDDNSDIFSKLAKRRPLKKNRIKEIKKKFDLEDWYHVTVKSLQTSQYIKYVDLNGEKISKQCRIIDILYNDNGTIKSIQLKERYQPYKWKIKPHKYYIFKHPSSEIMALMELL